MATGGVGNAFNRGECIHAVGSCSVSIAAPEGSQAYKTGERGGMFSFSRVCGPATTQANFFEGTVAPLVRAMSSGRQAENVVMSYGVTSSGKTYTIEGTQQAPGLIYRAVATLFKELEEGNQKGAEVFVSHYEVYNEQIFDLLGKPNPIGGRPVLHIKEDAAGRPTIVGLTDVKVPTAQAAMDTLRRGNTNRSRAETTLNVNSSRSHSVFAVTLQTPADGVAAAASSAPPLGVPGVAFRYSQQQSQQVAPMTAVSTSVLRFVDLAGSERSRRTGSVGERLKEATAINSSLMCLGRCLETLRWNQKYGDKLQPKRVPYRESKITHLFKSALHGWGRIMLIVNVSAAAADYDETVHVLKYAAVATQISTAARVELVQPPPAPVVAREIAAKRRKIATGGSVQVTHIAGAANACATKMSAALSTNVTKCRGGGRGGRGRGSRAVSGIGLDGVIEGQEDEAAYNSDDEEVVNITTGGSNEKGTIPAGGFDEDDDEEEEGVEEGHMEYDEEEEDWAEEREALLEEIEEMRTQIYELKKKNAAVETDVREEVSTEMAELLREMEATFQAKLEAEKKTAAAALAQAEKAIASADRRAREASSHGSNRRRISSGSGDGKRREADATRIRELEELLAAATAARDVAEAARDREAAAAEAARLQATTLTRQLAEMTLKAADADDLREELKERAAAAAEAEAAAAEAEAAAARAAQDKEEAIATERAAAAAAAAAAAIVKANQAAANVHGLFANSPTATAPMDDPVDADVPAESLFMEIEEADVNMQDDGEQTVLEDPAPVAAPGPGRRLSRRNSAVTASGPALCHSDHTSANMVTVAEDPEELVNNSAQGAEGCEMEAVEAQDVDALLMEVPKRAAPAPRRSRRNSTAPKGPNISTEHIASVAASVKYFESTPLQAQPEAEEERALANEDTKKKTPSPSRRRSRRSSTARVTGKEEPRRTTAGAGKENAMFNDDKGKEAEKKPRIEPIREECSEEEEEERRDGQEMTHSKVEAKALAGVKGALRPLNKNAANGIMGKTPVAHRTRGGRARV